MKQKIVLFVLGIVTLAYNPLFVQAQVITLDLSKPVDPSALTFDEEKGQWTDSFSDAPLVFEHFTFSHDGGMYGTSGYWSGFVVGTSGDTCDYGSANSASTDGWLLNQWGNMAGGGIKTNPDGSVVKDEEDKVLTEKGIPYLIVNEYGELAVTFDKTYEAVGVYLNNHPWPYYGNLYGDGYARALDQEGDYYKVIITGLNPETGETGKVEHLFAEYKDGQLVQNTDWEWVDLSSLGKISSLTLTLTSTDMGEWGMNTSGYFCLDKLQVRHTETDLVPSVVATVQLYPNPVVDRLIVSGSAIRQVTITDLSGRTVYQYQASDQARLTIPVSAWAKGVYVVSVWDNSGRSTHKIIKK
ncbi:MAG: DUF4465 domain-containing protein [Tannerella sp.]|jgi:hypothetical protein|nr:DUF4465 domain-containing protein [Tannerella sp.]